MELVAVIMAGGKGERFWPKSRASYPKQFLKLFGERTMLQHTVDRILPLMKIENVFIVTNADYKNIIKEQLPDLPDENIILEPVGRNTAPCIGLAARHITKKIPDSVMLVLPSDHMILNIPLFQDILKNAAQLANREKALVTLGIKPDKPETGYGYIKFFPKEEAGAYQVDRFVEKPDLETAWQYLNSGQYLWNSGMFIWKTAVILEQLEKYLPGMAKGLQNIAASIGTSDYQTVLSKEFPLLEAISIDYGVLEKADNIYVFASDFGWDDVGSWTAIERINLSDQLGNVIKGNVINIGSKGCIIEGSEKLIAAVGLEDLIIVDTTDVMLICQKNQAQRIKEVLQELQDDSLK